MSNHKMTTRSKSIEAKQMYTIPVLQNQLILSNILSFLPLDDLKNTRQVNHLWKNEAQKYFLLRGVVQINFDTLKEKFAMDVETYLDECPKINKYHVDFAMSLSGDDYHTKQYPDDVMKRFQEKIEQFLQSNGARIRFLKLMLNLFNDITAYFKFVFGVLQCVPKLEELEFFFFFPRNNFISEDGWLSNCEVLVPFTHLKKLKLELIFISELKDTERSKLEQFARNLLKLTPNLESLNLQLLIGKFNMIYLKELVGLQLEWKESESVAPMPFRNLSELSLNLKNLEQPLKLLQPIRKLSLTGHNKDLKENSMHLQALLKKHAQTLESFEFNFSLEKELLKIDLPSLPKLQSLKLDVQGFPNLLDAVDVFKFLEFFMTGGKSFENKFPSLRSFELKNDFFGPRLYERILPRPNQDVESVDLCFPQFTFFDLSVPLDENREECNEWMIWLAKLFPNVHNPEFNRARLLNEPPVMG